MNATQHLSEIVKPAVDLLFPPRCPLCGDAIAEQRGRCAGCWSELEIPAGPSCATCQRPFGEQRQNEGAMCAPCLAKPPKHDGIAAGTLYNDASRKLILAFKHGRKIALSDMMARLMVARLPQLDGDWLIVPVPLHRSRIWVRGYNQASLLAGDIAKLAEHRLLVDGLVRKKRTPPLGGLGRKERARTLAGAIDVNPSRAHAIKGANVVLVDDVLTSGATSDACVKRLKRAGAKAVVITCFARVFDEARNTKSPGVESETPEV